MKEIMLILGAFFVLHRVLWFYTWGELIRSLDRHMKKYIKERMNP